MPFGDAAVLVAGPGRRDPRGGISNLTSAGDHAGRHDDFVAVERFAALVHDLGSRDPSAAAGELTEIALALSAVLQPGLDIRVAHRALDALAGRCQAATRDGVVDGVVLTGRLIGDRETYGDWRNSCLDQVMAKGSGIPITLSTIVIEVGRRLGVPLHGIGMPAQFLVGDPADPDWFFDPFHARSLDRDGCRALLADMVGDRIPWHDGYLRPLSTVDVVIRMLNNLKASLVRRRDAVRLALVMRMRMAIPQLASEEGEAVRSLAVFN